MTTKSNDGGDGFNNEGNGAAAVEPSRVEFDGDDGDTNK